MGDNYLKTIYELENLLSEDKEARTGECTPYYLLHDWERIVLAQALQVLCDKWYSLNHTVKP